MTIEQFDEIGFDGDMEVFYQGKKYPVISVDFDEKLIGIEEFIDSPEPMIGWKRCENCELVKG